MKEGGGLLAFGGAATLLSYLFNASHGDYYTVFWGAMVLGAFLLLLGFIRFADEPVAGTPAAAEEEAAAAEVIKEEERREEAEDEAWKAAGGYWGHAGHWYWQVLASLGGVAIGAVVVAGLAYLGVVVLGPHVPDTTLGSALAILWGLVVLLAFFVAVMGGAWLTARAMRSVLGLRVNETVMMKEAFSRLPCCGGCVVMTGLGATLFTLLVVALAG